MPYSITILRAARRTLAQLQPAMHERIWAVIQGLGLNPRPAGCVKLTNSPYRRVRVGDYRVVYEIDDGYAVIIAVVAHRREAFR